MFVCRRAPPRTATQLQKAFQVSFSLKMFSSQNASGRYGALAARFAKSIGLLTRRQASRRNWTDCDRLAYEFGVRAAPMVLWSVEPARFQHRPNPPYPNIWCHVKNFIYMQCVEVTDGSP